MSPKISTWGKLLASGPGYHSLLEDFMQGSDHVVVRPRLDTYDLVIGSAIKAAPGLTFGIPESPDSNKLTVPVRYGVLNVYSHRITEWDTRIQRPTAEYLGLLPMPKEYLPSICVPLEMLKNLEFATVY